MKTDIDLLKDIQPTGDLAVVSAEAETMKALEDDIEEMERLISHKKKEIGLCEARLIEKMDDCHLSEITLNNGVKFKVLEITSASIPSQGSIDRAKDEEKEILIKRRDTAHEHIREIGEGDSIKHSIKINVPVGRDFDRDAIEKLAQAQGLLYQTETKIDPKTLNAIVKYRQQEGKEISHEKLHVFMGRRVKITGGSHE
tara:strand:- start:16 stop:612 length:597 start_codon:yes stop_codon:yes gene_type:complete